MTRTTNAIVVRHFHTLQKWMRWEWKQMLLCTVHSCEKEKQQKKRRYYVSTHCEKITVWKCCCAISDAKIHNNVYWDFRMPYESMRMQNILWIKKKKTLTKDSNSMNVRIGFGLGAYFDIRCVNLNIETEITLTRNYYILLWTVKSSRCHCLFSLILAIIPK